MSIFGNSFPKIIVNIATTQDEVLLQHAVVLKDEPELDSYGVRAVRTGKRVFNNAGKHWLFQVKIYLWKYADAEAKYLEFKGYEGTKVWLYRRSDGSPFLDKENKIIPFIFLSADESYTDDFNLFDVLTLTFRSLDYTGDEAPFNPYDLDYEAYYLMNEITNTPQGSIDRLAHRWRTFDNLLIDYKSFWGQYLDEFAMYAVNGYKAVRIYRAEVFPYPHNPLINRYGDATQLLVDCQDFTYVGGFKKFSTHTEWNSLFVLNTSDLADVFKVEVGGTFKVTMANKTGDATSIVAESVATFNGGDWQVFVIKFDQTNKTLSVNLSNGEELIATDEAYISASLTTTQLKNPTLGCEYQDDILINYFSGALGDQLFFREILNTYTINKIASWVCSRIGIAWTEVL